MPEEGLEPSRPCGQRILSPLRLPIPPLGHNKNSNNKVLIRIELNCESKNLPFYLLFFPLVKRKIILIINYFNEKLASDVRLC